jgi:hypothetical protein
VAARLEDEQPPHVVEALERVAAPLQHGAPAQGLDASCDDAKRLAARVVVDGADPQH